MSTVEMKTEIQLLLEQVDAPFVEAIHSLLNAHVTKQDEPIIGYDMQGNPRYASVAKKEYAESIEAMNRGEYIAIEDLEKESESWLKKPIKS